MYQLSSLIKRTKKYWNFELWFHLYHIENYNLILFIILHSMCEAFKGIQINYRIIFIFYFILIFPYFFETVINKMNEMIFFSNAFVVLSMKQI